MVQQQDEPKERTQTIFNFIKGKYNALKSEYKTLSTSLNFGDRISGAVTMCYEMKEIRITIDNEKIAVFVTLLHEARPEILLEEKTFLPTTPIENVTRFIENLL